MTGYQQNVYKNWSIYRHLTIHKIINENFSLKKLNGEI